MCSFKVYCMVLVMTMIGLLHIACSSKTDNYSAETCPRVNIQTGTLNYDISYNDLPYTVFTDSDVIVTPLHCALSAVHHYNNDYLKFIYNDLPNDGGSVSVSIDNFKTWRNLYIMKY